MTLKQFNADVAAAKRASFEGVSNVRRGDSDGEVVFTFRSESLNSSLDIQALAPDPDLYPSKSTFIIFTTTELRDESINSMLEQLAPACRGKTVCEVINTISCRLSGGFTSCELDDSEEADQFEDHEMDDLEPSDLSDSQLFGFPALPSGSGHCGGQRRLRRDLQAARLAGLRVGVLKGPSSSNVELISLSIRTSKLGIQEEALEAWDLRVTDYLVLLFQFPREYPPQSEFLKFSTSQTDIKLRFGTCKVPKPSLESARRALISHPRKRQVVKEPEQSESQTTADSHRDDFRPLHMSKVVDSLLNEQVYGLLSLRRTHNIGWDDAQARLFRHHRSTKSDRGQAPSGVDNLKTLDDDGPMITKDTPEALRHDYAMDEESFNIPLVYMQFALRRLAKCTQYCMVCHQKMPGGFEAVKPYICSDELCLYQYLSLGLGTSIEHEIVHSPHVVDLLVSFFYAALNTKALRHFPQGLGLKAVCTGTSWTTKEHFKAEANVIKSTIRFKQDDKELKVSLRENRMFLLVIRGMNASPTTSMLNGELDRHFCQVVSIHDTSCDFQIMQPCSEPLEDQPYSVYPFGSSSKSSTLGEQAGCSFNSPTIEGQWAEAMVFLQKYDLEDLDKDERDYALILLTNRIPPILEMRAYLLEKPGRGLDTMEGLDSNVLSLLRWIVASNTSLIVQDDQVPEPNDLGSKNNANMQKVQGLGGGWMQFRFAQGSPEKEQRFVEALDAMKKQNLIPAQYPTMFAWHGSPVGNWHSIIRSGLDFQSQLHGRAYGNGVYFSDKMSVSLSYRSAARDTVTMTYSWPNSQLVLKSAISICEVINCQKSFVTNNPYYVVDKTEWIQCRYLFVEVNPTKQAISQSLDRALEQSCDEYLVLDPVPKGANDAAIGIPSLALPAGRRFHYKTRSGGNRKSNRLTLSRQSPKGSPSLTSDDEDDGIDLEFLAEGSDGGQDELYQDGKRRRGSMYESTNVSVPASKIRFTTRGARSAETSPECLSKGVTSFIPGVLDLTSLPKLPEPAWASSTTSGALRHLNREILQLQKLQSTGDQESLGWYINFDRLNNVFHWIVELHSFDLDLPLAHDMERIGCKSVVLELRFGSSFPFSPPFVRVIRPRFKPFAQGGGGHVTAGGAICSELLTNSGWSPALSIDKVFLDVRLRICDLNPPARLEQTQQGDYGIVEAADAYGRAVRGHGWEVPKDLDEIVKASWE